MNFRPLLRTLPLVFLCGCAQVLDIEDTELDETPPAPTGPWRCLGQAASKPSVIPPKITLTMTALAYGLPPTPTAGITFRACPDISKPTCETSVGSGITEDPATGTVSFDVDTINGLGFVGFIQILDTRTPEQKGTGESFVPFHWFFASPLYANTVVPPSVVATQTDIDGLATGAGKPPKEGENSGVNHVSATVVDCDSKSVANATLDITSAGTKPTDAIAWYFRNGTASASAAGTDDFGLGGALFLDANRDYSVVARRSDGTVTSQGTLKLVPGAFSTILMLPQ